LAGVLIELSVFVCGPSVSASSASAGFELVDDPDSSFATLIAANHPDPALTRRPNGRVFEVPSLVKTIIAGCAAGGARGPPSILACLWRDGAKKPEAQATSDTGGRPLMP
jgi:hypothetical protein